MISEHVIPKLFSGREGGGGVEGGGGWRGGGGGGGGGWRVCPQTSLDAMWL